MVMIGASFFFSLSIKSVKILRRSSSLILMVLAESSIVLGVTDTTRIGALVLLKRSLGLSLSRAVVTDGVVDSFRASSIRLNDSVVLLNLLKLGLLPEEVTVGSVALFLFKKFFLLPKSFLLSSSPLNLLSLLPLAEVSAELSVVVAGV